MFSFSGDGDVEGGTVLGVGGGIILGSMIWSLSNRFGKLDRCRDHRRWHWRSRGSWLDHGGHGRVLAAASPEAVAYSE